MHINLEVPLKNLSVDIYIGRIFSAVSGSSTPAHFPHVPWITHKFASTFYQYNPVSTNVSNNARTAPSHILFRDFKETLRA